MTKRIYKDGIWTVYEEPAPTRSADELFAGHAAMVSREERLPEADEIKWPFKRMLNDHLIIYLDRFKYKGQIKIPKGSESQPTTGIVVAKAANITDIEIGDRILLSQFAGYLLKFAGVPLCRSISYSEILGIMNEDAPALESESA